MAKRIAILEDNDERRDEMGKWLADRLSMYESFFTDDPAQFIAFLRERPQDTLAISLDHDLHERPDHSTELTGMQVLDYLVGIEPAFPVLLHTTNRIDGVRMQKRLLKRGWKVTWVSPFDGISWVGDDWYPALKRAIRTSAVRQPVPVGDEGD